MDIHWLSGKVNFAVVAAMLILFSDMKWTIVIDFLEKVSNVNNASYF